MAGSNLRRGSDRLASFRTAVHALRTESSEPARDAVAIGVGVFIGCLPIYGLHLVGCVGAAKILKLNQLKTYVAANISNPFAAPLLLLLELQTGALLRTGTVHSVTLGDVSEINLWLYAQDVLVGSVVLGLVLGSLALLATRATTRWPKDDPLFSELVRRASDRYIRSSVTAWEFARAKLRLDPVYRQMLVPGVLPGGGTLVDIGCGQGLSLALLVEATDSAREIPWPQSLEAPVFNRLIGLDARPRVAQLAKAALGDRAHIMCTDARMTRFESCSAVLLFDVLHMLPESAQRELLARSFDALEPGGTLLVRDVDAGAGWRFQLVRLGNTLKSLAAGRWRPGFYFRTRAGWLSCFSSTGFHASIATDASRRANVLFRLTKPEQAEL